MTEFAHGQLWWADFAGDKIRPAMILTRSWVAPRLNRLLVAPVTSRRRNIPAEVLLGAAEGVSTGSVANFDNVQLLEVERLLSQMGSVEPTRWPEVCAAVAHVIACDR